jgi:hypothetical protein
MPDDDESDRSDGFWDHEDWDDFLFAATFVFVVILLIAVSIAFVLVMNNEFPGGLIRY